MPEREQLLWAAYLSDDGNVQAARRVIFAHRGWCARRPVTRARLLAEAEALFVRSQVTR